MSLNMLWRRLIRRPFVLMIILVFAALAGFAGWNSADNEAESRMALLVVPPWHLEDENFPNPVLNLTDRTTQLASALVIMVQSNDAQAFVAESGATGYTVSNIGENLRNPVPTSVIHFVVTGPDATTAHAGAERLIVKLRQILQRMQFEAAVGNETTMANLQVIVPPQETTLVGKQQIRAAALFGLATFFTCILLYWGIESMLDRRSRDLGHTYPLGHRTDDSLNPAPTNSYAPMEPVRQSE
jgi:hypothetical protein